MVKYELEDSWTKVIKYNIITMQISNKDLQLKIGKSYQI